MMRIVILIALLTTLMIAGCGPTTVSETGGKSKTTEYLQIQPGWEWKVDKYGYSYINGSVKNVGTKSIKYFEVTAEYLGENGNVLDTTYTNSVETIMPGNEKRFEIMHKHSPDFKKSRLKISKIMFD